MSKKLKEKIMKETEQLLANDAAIISIYEKVLNGQLKTFPKYTWELPNSLYYAKVLTQYLFEVKLKWTKKDIKENFNQRIIRKYRLLGMYKALFLDKQFAMIDNAYPEQFKPWEFKRTSRGSWEMEENRRDALRWLFEEKLDWDINSIKEKTTQKTFKENNLGGLLATYFDDSPFKAIDFIYPNQIKPWELQKATYNFWNSDENKINSIKWLFEEKLNWSVEDVKEHLSRETFIQNGFGGLLAMFNGSPYDVFNFAYPNKLKPWEMKQVSRSYWDSDENKREALKWLFEEKIKWTMMDIKNASTKKIRNVIRENGLGGLLSKKFNDSVYQLMKFLYPNEEFELLEKQKKK